MLTICLWAQERFSFCATAVIRKPDKWCRKLVVPTPSSVHVDYAFFPNFLLNTFCFCTLPRWWSLGNMQKDSVQLEKKRFPPINFQRISWRHSRGSQRFSESRIGWLAGPFIIWIANQPEVHTLYKRGNIFSYASLPLNNYYTSCLRA